MKLDQPALIENLPVYEDDLARIKKKKKDFENILHIQMNRLMNYRRVEAADLHKALGLSFSTLHDWVLGKVGAQFLGNDIKRVAQYFGVSVDFLAFGTPQNAYDQQLDDAMPDLDEVKEYDSREAI